VFKNQYSQYYFYAKNVEIMQDFCDYCNETHDEFLKEFSKYDTSGYCLAVLFTHRDFPGGIQGLAYRNFACYNKYNTAFITFLNHEVTSSKQNSIITLAHEVGHSFGAYHDQDTSCNAEAEQYIMSAKGSDMQKDEFSTCSLNDINLKLGNVSSKFPECFTDRYQEDYSRPSFCGNNKVEEGEECDCGLDQQKCEDACCYPGLLTQYHRDQNSSARPCHQYSSQQCLQPWNTFIIFGLVVPWVFILVSVSGLTLLLCLDWRKHKKLFLHLQEYEAVKQDQRNTFDNTRNNLSPVTSRITSQSQTTFTNSSQFGRVGLETNQRRIVSAPQRSQPPFYNSQSRSSAPSNPRARLGPAPPPPSPFQIQNQSNVMKSKLKPTSTNSYTSVPQRAAPPPPKN